ncbi:hypothetical protein GCM10010172_82510 [Paractinoplanes ferrugineus]|uniref:Uncharacterized protein n=1 Tax=Paractinoplanes ferrugineus TaxID=113564 RepID=A0A919IZ63_9ACTN|nr:hypothetical protein [Actinoplanes ferrugineus]GIE10572.1 hypothetical protein Afe05nite_24120 [Actinoplanes ferrugineus]
MRVWNREAENLWGPRSAEAVGRHLLDLDVGLPVDRRGRQIAGRVAGSLLAGSPEPTGAIIVMEAGEFASGRKGNPTGSTEV